MPFKDPNLPVADRVDDLVARMTLREKISQMQNHARAVPRLGIPPYDWWNEALHGVARNGIATVFPQAIGMAATWNPELIREEADVISTEARAKHHDAVRHGEHGIYQGLTFWSPNINIVRDPRWGRAQETYGEDPYLTSRVAVAFVKGLQGSDPQYFKVIATPKHFAVHSGPEPLRHQFDARSTRRDLFETYLPAFEACIVEGKAWSIMGAYNRYDGEPCCASTLLLENILRGEWDFHGYVVSDCGAIRDIFAGHKIAANAIEASALAVKRGCDLTCGNEYEALSEATVRGLITEQEIDRSVRRLMEARFRLGMFDPPQLVRYARIPISENDTPKHDALARRVARESIVLLKNEGHMLPLRRNHSRIAVVGPNADDVDVLLGNYNGTPSHPVTILQGIRAAAGNQTEVVYARGCEVADGLPPRLDPVPPECLLTRDETGVRAGLRGEYFDGTEPKGVPLLVRTDSTVNFTWENSPAQGLPADNFSIRWTGILRPVVSGTYHLGVTADDGCRLYVEDQLILEEWKDAAPRTLAREIELTAGREYVLRLEFYEHEGGATAVLGWQLRGVDPLVAALEAARQSDVVIAVVGLTPMLEGEEMSIDIPGFSGGDRTDLALPQSQSKMIRALAELGKPLVLIVSGGSALALNWEQATVPAILEVWYPGQQGGNAVADVLFGDYNPGGRLPITFYASVDDLPPFERYDMEGRTYRYFRGTPLYPFGHGLSYTQFVYRSLSVSKPTLRASETLRLRVNVQNVGPLGGDEVVQVYVRALDSPVSQPVKSLKGFARQFIRKGENRTISISVPVASFRRYDEALNKYVVDPGRYEVQVGASSSDIRKTAIVRVR
ncbi:MAG: glycoside hydrolase family 3 C-terminal domain-containing protein [Bacteroidota bacterium]